MKRIDNILYIEVAEFVEAGVKEASIWQASSRKSSSWTFIKDPADNRKILAEYEKLADKYKDMIKARFGDPYDYMAKKPIKEMVKWDDEAELYFLNYRYDGNKCLTTGRDSQVEKYTRAASWLNMLLKVNEDKKAIKKDLGITLDQFYTKVSELIKSEKIDLPTTYHRLLAKMESYKNDGYRSLISWKLGNKLAAKVSDEVSESVLLEMIANGNQFDDVFIAQQYNKWAKANEYKEISDYTVGVHRRNKEWEIIEEREGSEAFRNKYGKKVKGFRPSFPLAMVESDDNHIDLQFIEVETGNKNARYKAIVVTDSYNDYVLGYAYTLNPVTMDLVQAAYINAMYYIRSLTKEWHLPHEIKADNFGIKELAPFYKSIGNFIATPVGSKARGYIEQFFGTPHWKRCLKLGANNYIGNNITAKNRGVNMDMVRANTKSRPHIGEQSENQIEQFFHNLRHLPNKDGVSKHQQWMEAWEQLPSEKKRSISDEQFLLKFGIHHNPTRPIQIRNGSVNPEIDTQKYSYVLTEYNLQDNGRSVTVIYDPYDMSRVLITDFGKIRYLALEPRLSSRALADATTHSRTFLNSIFNEKKDEMNKMHARADKRKEILKTHNIDAETVLQAGVLEKEVRQFAEQKIMREIEGPKTDNDNNIFNQL